MRILDKYILKQMLGPFCFGVAAFSTIFVASSFLFRVAQYLTEYGASASSLIRLFFCLMVAGVQYFALKDKDNAGGNLDRNTLWSQLIVTF